MKFRFHQPHRSVETSEDSIQYKYISV